MSTRIQQVLDGEIGRETLRPDELRELDAWEEAIDTALAAVRQEPAPDLSGEVMRRISRSGVVHDVDAGKAEKRSAWSNALAWLFAPRPVSVTLRPAAVLAAAAIGALLLAAPWAGPGSTGTPPAVAGADAPADAPAKVVVHFRLEAPGAQRVELAGDFTGWQPAVPLSEALPGVWTVAVPLEPGVHEYAFVVDGERWVADPLAPRVEDGFGGDNSRIDVLAPLTRGAL